MFVFLVLMLMLKRKTEQHKTNKWIRSSAYAYASVAGVLTCLYLYHAYACAYLYALVRTSLYGRGLKAPVNEDTLLRTHCCP